MFYVSNDAMRGSLWEALRDSMGVSLWDLIQSAYKEVEYVSCV